VSGACTERGEQQLLFVLEALEAAEREEFEAHLAACEHCTEAVRTAREALEPDAASARTDEESLERVRRRLRQRVSGTPGHTAPRPAAARSAFPRAALAAGVAIALVGAGGYWLHRREAAQWEERHRALERRTVALEQEVAQLAGQRDALDAQLELAQRKADVLGAKNLVLVPLEPVGPGQDARARIFWDPPTLRCYLLARGLSPLADDRRYALWVFTASGEAILVGSFSADGAGQGALYAELPPAAAERIDRVVVTDEPASIGAAPTGAEHLIWLRPV